MFVAQNGQDNQQHRCHGAADQNRQRNAGLFYCGKGRFVRHGGKHQIAAVLGGVYFAPAAISIAQVYHNIYHSWSWLGGHADGETDLLAVAIREVKEEAGIRHVQPVSKEIFSLESLTVDGHVKRGCYVSSHLHLNVTYLLEADCEEAVAIKADENSGVAWFTPEEALVKSTEPWFVEHVYAKLLEKMKTI